jgi:5-(carboxyamino)imidazole ribonucleotide synthase
MIRNDERRVLPPGSVIGIVGGGQLGRMLALAAARLGMKTHIYCPDPLSPALDVTPRRTVADYDNEPALAAFASAVDVVTYEFENVPLATAEYIARYKPLRPGARALGIAQDRLAEKAFLAINRVPIAPFAAIASTRQLVAEVRELGLPAVLKTTRLGYDGKGQQLIEKHSEVPSAFAALEPKPLVLEAYVPFTKEVSVVIARGLDGDTAAFEPTENMHSNHILKLSRVPARLGQRTAARAVAIAAAVAAALDYVGVLGVEFFVLSGGRLLVNEVAPRVHNSGHWTEAVCVTDQFEQHIRAICGWPLGDSRRLADVVMENLLGEEADTVPGSLKAGDRLHLYGKTQSRPGRKMGHISRIALSSLRT